MKNFALKKTNSAIFVLQLESASTFHYLCQFLEFGWATNLFCSSNPKVLIEPSVDALDGLAAQSKTETELKFLVVETSVKSKLIQTFSYLNHRRCRNEPVMETKNRCIEEEEYVVLRQISQTQNYQLIDLNIPLERYCNVLLSAASTAQFNKINNLLRHFLNKVFYCLSLLINDVLNQ